MYLSVTNSFEFFYAVKCLTKSTMDEEARKIILSRLVDLYDESSKIYIFTGMESSGVMIKEFYDYNDWTKHLTATEELCKEGTEGLSWIEDSFYQNKGNATNVYYVIYTDYWAKLFPEYEEMA